MKNTINYTYKNNLTMTIETVDKKVYQNNTNVLFDNTNNYFVYYGRVRPQYRVDVIKNEILMNLPKVITNVNDLRIYIRSGDIFRIPVIISYYQPPLCFYKNIIDNFKFENIYIISENKNNPVIDQILSQFPNIIYKINSLKYDMSILINAYNIVGGFSTFLKTLILLNDNLLKFWYFNYQTNLLFSYFFDYEFSHKNLSIFKMKEFDFYIRMNQCNNLKDQMKLMINYTCKYPFNIIK